MEIVYTKCDKCEILLGCTPEAAENLYFWRIDEYEQHICPSCIHDQKLFDEDTANPSEIEDLSEALTSHLDEENNDGDN